MTLWTDSALNPLHAVRRYCHPSHLSSKTDCVLFVVKVFTKWQDCRIMKAALKVTPLYPSGISFPYLT